MAAINFDYLSLVSENDREFETELLQVYIEDGECRLQNARSAIEGLNWEELAREAHQLKGASGNVGAQELHSLAMALETAAKASNLDESKHTLHLIVKQFQEIKELFRTRYSS